MNDDQEQNSCSLITRRRFLAGLGATVATAACAGKSVTVFKQDKTKAAPSPSAGPGPVNTTAIPQGALGMGYDDRTLVVVELGGGNDSLNTVVPHADSAYYDLRPNVGITDAIDLDGEIGLHPRMPLLADRYGSGTVAIVEGVGYPDPNLSHFESMRVWWDASKDAEPELGSVTGWLGRYLDGTVGYSDLLAGITIGPGPSQAMLGAGSFVVNIADGWGLRPQVPWWVDENDEFMAMWKGFAPHNVPLAELTPIERAIKATVDASDTLNEGLEPLQQALQDDIFPNEDSWTVTGQLRTAAHLIASGVAPRVIYVHGFGDYDHHDDIWGRHGDLSAQLDRGIDEFFKVLDETGTQDNAILMTTSEFGRRPAESETGTDHGTAASHFIIGSPIAGGRYGESPSLRRLTEDGNLIHTVDFRSVFATVLDDWLGVPHHDVLGASYETLPVIGA